MTNATPIFTDTWFLPAGECDAQGRMPLPLIATRIIDIATAHANALGIGYADLIKHNIGWVLSRLSIEMLAYPAINSDYTLTTWIESINRRFSERNFALSCDGRTVGYARSVWAAIDFEHRTAADLSVLDLERCPIGDLDCPIAKSPRIPALPPEAACEGYRFRYCDLDFNRHVNTVRYLELLMDAWDLDWYDGHEIARVDLQFSHECRFGEEVKVVKALTGKDTYDCEIVRESRAVAARFTWRDK